MLSAYRPGRIQAGARSATRALLVAAVSTACGSTSAAFDTEYPDRVILLIGDGTGVAQWSAGLYAAGELAVAGFPVVGLVDTRNMFGKITDSGAAATALATGVPTFNRGIGVGPDSAALESVCDAAELFGKATGLVVTSSVVHATPASFVAKVPDRYRYESIAEQLAGSSLEVLLGGGLQFFDAEWRTDSWDLLGALRARHVLVENEEGLLALKPDTVSSLVGLFALDDMSPASERRPSLALMTQVALAVLDHDSEGFFLMVEGSQIDWRGHENAPIDELAAEVLDFDAAITVAVEYASRRPGTLIVVTGDHETGGLALVSDGDGFAASYSHTSHTAELVPLFASGPGAERFTGIQTNAQVGQALLDLIRSTNPPAD
jgi:alkaline phosphatase